MNVKHTHYTEQPRDSKIQKDVDILGQFICIFCTEKHKGEKLFSANTGGIVSRYLEKSTFKYCGDCLKLLLHAVSKRVICPYDPKPACKKCMTHCYGPGYRDRIREVMRFSGIHLIKRGRVDLIKKYFS
jgi:hypothetical protein